MQKIKKVLYVTIASSTLLLSNFIFNDNNIKANEKIEIGKESSKLKDGEYDVHVSLNKYSDETKPSMAAKSLKKEAKLLVEKGKSYLIVEFDTLQFMGMYGNAEDIKYFVNKNDDKNLKDVEVLSYRNNAKVGSGNSIKENVKRAGKIKLPLTTGKGTYISMNIDVMNMRQEAFISVDISDAYKQALLNLVNKAEKLVKENIDEYSKNALTDLINSSNLALKTNSNDYEVYINKLETVINKVTKIENKKEIKENKTNNKESKKENLKKSIDLKSKNNKQNKNKTKSIVSNSKTLQDGVYEVPIYLWNANLDKPSMAAPSLEKTAKIKVENGIAHVYITTKEMHFAGISARLEELKIKRLDGSFIDAKHSGSVFEFTLEEKDVVGKVYYLDILVNPHVAIMGNSDIPARFKFDFTNIKTSNLKDVENNKTKEITKTSSNENVASILPINSNTEVINTRDKSGNWLLVSLISFLTLITTFLKKGVINE